MNLLGFIMSLVHMQAVHGWLSAYERLVNSQNFFSPYLTQEDMSRFGRDYLNVGLYTEMRFPELGIRFIAVNDGVDSADDSTSDFTPFRNIINEWYCRDVSKKIKASMKARAAAGQHLKAYAPYGYRKSETNKNQWLIDEEVADVVRDVFSLFIGGMGAAEIAEEMNRKGLLPPREYKESKGFPIVADGYPSRMLLLFGATRRYCEYSMNTPTRGIPSAAVPNQSPTKARSMPPFPKRTGSSRAIRRSLSLTKIHGRPHIACANSKAGADQQSCMTRGH